TLLHRSLPLCVDSYPIPTPSLLALHDALPISGAGGERLCQGGPGAAAGHFERVAVPSGRRNVPGEQPQLRLVRSYARKEQRHVRSEEHTSELQSHLNLVCRLLLERKKQKR